MLTRFRRVTAALVVAATIGTTTTAADAQTIDPMPVPQIPTSGFDDAWPVDGSFGTVGTGDVFSLGGSSYTLSDIDPFTGAVTGPGVRMTLTDEYAAAMDHTTSSAMLVDTARLAQQARQEADAAKARDARARAGSTGAQGDVGPEGCPTSAPGNTMRRGSADLGVYELCVRSVAQARSPQAAAAIKEALAHLGTPYSQPKRNQEGWSDCSSFVTRAYQRSGTAIAPPGQNAPTTATIPRMRWAVRVSYADSRPGDLALRPSPGHVVMLLADGWMVHTTTPGDVSHVTRQYSSFDDIVYVDPARV